MRGPRLACFLLLALEFAARTGVPLHRPVPVQWAATALDEGPQAVPALPPRAITAIDGDTVRVDGRTVRLVGFDAPETFRAKCAAERERGDRATARLRALIAAGDAAVAFVPCACRPGTEGTLACNWGRACGVLTVGGRDAADIMIEEGLARPYRCGARSCPPRGGWCGGGAPRRPPRLE